MTVDIRSKEDALQLFEQLEAPGKLKKHAILVCEVAETLLQLCASLKVDIDAEFVRIGAVLHDVGKITFPNELIAPGAMHLMAGQQLLLKKGVPTKIAAICVSHKNWPHMQCATEELLIALADTLWKGKRSELLELKVIDAVANKLHKDRWELFPQLDEQFESIALKGDQRLQRSQVW